MNHPESVAGYSGSLAQLAGELGDLRYDALAEFLREFSEKLRRDAEADQGRGRPRLAGHLSEASRALADAATHIQKAWDVSEPHM